MNQLSFVTLLTAGLMLFTACGESKKENNTNLNAKKEKLAALVNQQEKLVADISKLTEEIEAIDPEMADKSFKLVSVDTLVPADFNHYIELQGKVDAFNISIVTPRGNPGQVKEIYVRKGDIVKKGQLLLKLDDAIYRQNIIAGSQNINTLKTQLALATDLLQRQQNLWSQGIGTEVQLITAKSNVETLRTQIRGAEEQIKVLQEQQKTTNVYAEVSGIADDVNVRVGEFFQGAVGNLPQIRIVNTSLLKAITNVPENYASRVSRGSQVFVEVPDLGKTFQSSISFISASIDPNNRSFVTEANLPFDQKLKPNMIAMVKILDYSAPEAITIPVNVVQSDASGKYVFVINKSGDKQTAVRKTISIGQVQNEKVEIKGGLAAGDVLITAGFQGLYDGQEISISENL